jgi:DNA-binding NtrC family response regulator
MPIAAESPVSDRADVAAHGTCLMSAKKTRILVVNKETAIFRFLRPTFLANDYDVVTAGTVAEATKRIAAEGPDIVALDLATATART